MAAPKRERWGSRYGFILAAAGSAIGLGNVWKFPYVAGENGGAAFVFIYLLCVAVIGLPVLVAEILIGRASQKNPVGAFKKLARNRAWMGAGAMGVVGGFIIISFYAVVGGWTMGYVVEALRGALLDFNSPEVAEQQFDALNANPWWVVGFQALFFGVTMAVVIGGIKNGIERFSKLLMPVLFVILAVLIVRGVTLEGASEGLAFLFSPNWSAITAGTVLEALGQAFFTLSLGMGAMMTYGSYLSDRDNIWSCAVQIVVLDTLIAIMAGLAIFTTVFAVGLDPAGGPGLIFQTLPVVFNRMPWGGLIFAPLFFVLLTIAALTSSISMLEVIVAYFVDEMGMSRRKAVLIFGGVAMALGVPSALSFNLWSEVKLFGKTFFQLADFVASNIMLPLGGLLFALFVAWSWGWNRALPELAKGAERYRHAWFIAVWKVLLKFVVPVLILVVLLNAIGVL